MDTLFLRKAWQDIKMRDRQSVKDIGGVGGHDWGMR